MKKILSLLLLAAIAVGANAQKDSTNEVWFKIQKEGCFATEDGNDYIIYHQEGKTAKELYDMVCVNANRIYNMPQRVISTVDGKSVSIRGFSDDCMCFKSLGTKTCYDVFYNLLFEFKDGKIKILSPVISSVNHGKTSFRNVVKYYYDYKGKMTKSGKQRKEHTENYFDQLIAEIIGKSQKSDW